MLVEEIVNRLHNNGFEVYYVGGAPRDSLLNKKAKDIDLCTNAKPEQIIKIFSDKKVCMVGSCFKVVIVEGIEVATFRLDRQEKMYNSKHCKPEFAKTIEEDLARRDLTCNAIAINAITGEVIDPFGGKNDIKHGIIRFVGNPYDRIKEDPCRILRTCRFLAALEGSFSVETLQALKDCVGYVKNHVEPERIRAEILKALELKTPSIFFSALHLIGALKYIFPALDECVEHTGGKYHGEDLWAHCLSACDNISPKFVLLRLAAILHDIGKVAAWNPDTGSFIDHETIGGKLVKQYLRKLKFSNNEVLKVSNLVYAHMRQCRNMTPKGTRRLRKYLADYNINPRDYIRLKLADRQANMLKDTNTFTPIKELIIGAGIRRIEENIPFSVRDLAITGGQLIEELGLKPGPIVGKIQKELLEIVIEEGIEYNTYNKLKEIAMQIQSNPHSHVHN